MDGVWESARGCMRNYLILREKALAFRADPEVAAALEAAGVAELALPTLGDGESLDDVRSASYDVEGLGARSVAMEALDQLAMEHLLGVR
jgi:xylose isomerase